MEKNVDFANGAKPLINEQDTFQHDKLKTEFFANISHEFKTPLNVLLGAMQLLELYASNGTIIDPELKLDKYMKTMKQNAHRLLRLINNIIDLTKIDSSYFLIDFHNYDIVTIVEGIIDSISLYANLKSINVSFKKEVNKKVIACDIDKIERIMLNLLSNALKFTNENGNIEVIIKTEGNKVLISVKDDGIGIQEDKFDVIFERFRQVDKSFTRNREGSGIGLSLVKALVELHEGRISVNSEYGKGSEFIIEFPVRTLENEPEMDIKSQFEDGIKERLNVELSDF